MKIQAHVYKGSQNGKKSVLQHKQYLMLFHEKKLFYLIEKIEDYS